jgi:hypothetical protein
MERKQLYLETSLPVIVVVGDDVENANMPRGEIFVPEVTLHGASSGPKLLPAVPYECDSSMCMADVRILSDPGETSKSISAIKLRRARGGGGIRVSMMSKLYGSRMQTYRLLKNMAEALTIAHYVKSTLSLWDLIYTVRQYPPERDAKPRANIPCTFQ